MFLVYVIMTLEFVPLMVNYPIQIRTDIKTKGDFINDLIKKVVETAYLDIEDVLKFVDWLDGELSSLVSFNNIY